MSLFSVFDPTGIIGRENWLMFFVIFMLIWGSGYMVSGCLEGGWVEFLWSLGVYFSSVAFPYGSGVVTLVGGILVGIVMINLVGLFPFNFSVSSHIFYTLSMGVVFWVGVMLMGWLYKFRMSACHLVPEGAPIMLSPILVMIELVSHLIRPVTLSVRLAANMMAGHLIVSLVGIVSLLGWWYYLLSVGLQWGLMLLEGGVCIVQGVVFGILVMLYYVEFYSYE